MNVKWEILINEKYKIFIPLFKNAFFFLFYIYYICTKITCFVFVFILIFTFSKILTKTGWWSMAQLAAQDYFTRLQASGISAFPHPDLASAFPSSMGMGGVNNTGTSSHSSSTNRQNSGESKGKSRKEKKSNSSSGNNLNSSLNSNTGHNNIGGSGNNSSNIGGNSSGMSITAATSMIPSSSPIAYKVRNIQ